MRNFDELSREELVKQALDWAIDRTPSATRAGIDGPFFAASLTLGHEAIRALQIPQQQSAVFRMFQRVSLSSGIENDAGFVNLTAELVDEERAEQVRQLVAGAIAFVQLPIEELEEEEEFRLLRTVLNDAEVFRKGKEVICRLTITRVLIDQCQELLEEPI